MYIKLCIYMENVGLPFEQEDTSSKHRQEKKSDQQISEGLQCLVYNRIQIIVVLNLIMRRPNSTRYNN